MSHKYNYTFKAETSEIWSNKITEQSRYNSLITNTKQRAGGGEN